MTAIRKRTDMHPENTAATAILPGSLSTYVTGFTLSLLLTVMPFLIAFYHTVHGTALIATIVLFAVLQLFVQLEFFMHLGEEKGPRWKNMTFVFMVIIVLTVVVGSLWIMHNLNRHMTPSDIQKQVQSQDDL